MKKLIAIFMLVMVVSLSYPPESEAAWGLFRGLWRKITGTGTGQAGGGVSSVSAADPCAGITGNTTYLYNGDYTDDSSAACSSAKAKLTGTSAGSVTISSNYVLIQAVNSYLAHSITSSELSVSEGTICFSFYIIDDGDGNLEDTQIFEIGRASWDSNNYIYMQISGDSSGPGRLVANWKGNGTSDSALTASNSVDAATWYRSCYSWYPASVGNDHAIGIVSCGGTTEADCAGKNGWNNLVEVDDDLVAITAQPEVFRIGELANNDVVTDDVRVADVYIMSGYKTADPF